MDFNPTERPPDFVAQVWVGVQLRRDLVAEVIRRTGTQGMDGIGSAASISRTDSKSSLVALASPVPSSLSLKLRQAAWAKR